MALFDGKSRRLCLDQNGDRVWARTVKELREKSGYGSAPRKVYADKIAGPHAGKTVHCGYVIGPRWFTIYAPVEEVDQ